MTNTVETTALGESVQSVGVSAWDLFIGADWVVQSVMILLIVASFWSWTLIFAKSSKLRSLNKKAQNFEDSFWSGKSLQTLHDVLKSRPLDANDAMGTIFKVAMDEWQRNPHALRADSGHSLQQRVQRLINLTINKEMDYLERHMIFLASVGSTAPFVGLFGTVWGIMNSFQGIAMSQSTNLAVVAPGIAEALFATALGLIAAIPAVLGYNRISSEINRYGARLENFRDEFSTILSRKCEEAE
jgi:biopolymer transport protein TolQ